MKKFFRAILGIAGLFGFSIALTHLLTGENFKYVVTLIFSILALIYSSAGTFTDVFKKER